MGTKIEWAEETWNPIIGCSKVSPGCDHCYAEKMAGRLANMGQAPYMHVVREKLTTTDHMSPPELDYFLGKWRGKTYVKDHKAFQKPLHWKKPRTIFVCSMGDLFHETVSFNDILEVMHIIDKCPQHTFLILTKRPQRMHEFFTDWVPNPFWINGDFLPNVWLGVTAENQEMADERIPILLDIPAAKRFVSIEPMLGPVNLRELQPLNSNLVYDSIFGREYHNYQQSDWYSKSFNKLDWVICGGESGPGARPIHPDWVRSIRDQCSNACTPFMLKQRGEWVDEFHPLAIHGKYPISDQFINITSIGDYSGVYMYKVGKKKAGRELEGKIWNQKPE